MTVEISGIPIIDLPERWGISKATIYQRMHALGIVPEKVGKRSLLSDRQIAALDRYHDLLQMTPAEIAAWVVQSNFELSPAIPEAPPLDPMVLVRGLFALMERQQAVIAALMPGAEDQALAPYRSLKEAAEQGFVMPTSALVALGVSRSALRGEGGCDRGYRFVSAGRCGREKGWRVQGVTVRPIGHHMSVGQQRDVR